MNDLAPTLTQESVQALAFELALGYHPPDELADRFGVPESLIARVQDLPEFRRQVLIAKRQIDETGEQTRTVARKLVALLVPEIANIVTDINASHADRISAFKELKSLGGMQEQSQDAGRFFAIQINLGDR